MKKSLESRRLRARKRLRTWLYSILAVLVIGGAIVGVVYVSHARAVQIQTVKVEGAETIVTEDVIRIAEEAMAKPLLYVFSRRTMLTYPKTVTMMALQDIHGLVLKELSIRTSLHTMTISLTERYPKVEWCDGTQCALVDDAGLAYAMGTSTDAVFRIVSKDTSGVSPISIGQVVAPEPLFVALTKFIAALHVFGFNPSEITLTIEGDIYIPIKNNTQLIIALNQDTDATLRRINTLVTDSSLKAKLQSGTIDYIDLRFGNKIYFKEKRASDNATSTTTTTPKVQNI